MWNVELVVVCIYEIEMWEFYGNVGEWWLFIFGEYLLDNVGDCVFGGGGGICFVCLNCVFCFWVGMWM